MPPRRSPPKHRHDGTSPLPLGMDWSPPPKRWTGRDTVWPHDPQTGWSFCVTIPSWIVQPETGASDDNLINPIVFYRIQVGIQSPDGSSSVRGILRRFSDFLKLFSAVVDMEIDILQKNDIPGSLSVTILKKSFPKKNIPSAPPKHALLRINSSRLLLEERRYALEEWIGKLLSDIDLSRSVHVASFLELEAAARSSFQDVNMNSAETNLSDNIGLSTSLVVRASSGTSIGSLVASASHSLTSDYGSDNACETSEAESPRREIISNYETCNEDQPSVQFCSQTAAVMKRDILDHDKGSHAVLSQNPEEFPQSMVQSRIVLKEALLSGDSVVYTNELQHEKLSSHARRNSSESIGSDISSLRGSELSNTGVMNLLGDGFVDFSGGETTAATEALSSMDLLSLSDVTVILPVDQRHKLNRILLTMQRRLVTAKTDMEDLIARLNQEIAVKEYLATKVKDLEGELESTRQKSKENLQQALLVERERVTQMQWDMDELQRKTLEMEFRLNSEKNERIRAESEKLSAIREKEMLMHDFDAKKEQLASLQKRLEEVEIKSKGDIKVLVKEVKSLRNSQAELKEILNQSVKEKTELERVLQKEKQRWEDAKVAKGKILHECGILRHRLEDCSVNLFSEEEDKFTVNSSSVPDALDLLTTSDNRIGLLLAEAQLLAQDDENALLSAGKFSNKEHLGKQSTMNGEDPRAADDETRKMLTDVFIDNAKLRKQVNSVTRCVLKTVVKAEKEDSDATPVRKTVLTKLLER